MLECVKEIGAYSHLFNSREGGVKVVKINKREEEEAITGSKGVKSVTKSMRRGKFCKKLINEEEGI